MARQLVRLSSGQQIRTSVVLPTDLVIRESA
jgi:hypothetical protein